MAPVDIKTRFGTAIRTERKRQGLSQEELAGRANLHRTYVADIERGARNLSLANIEKLAGALGMPVAALFAGESGLPRMFIRAGAILLVGPATAESETLQSALGKTRLANPIHVTHDTPEALDYLFGEEKQAPRRLQDTPSLVLLDLSLPNVSRTEILRRMKGDERTRSVPVVIVSTAEAGPEVEEATRSGADAVLAIPVDLQRLARLMEQLALGWVLLPGRG